VLSEGEQKNAKDDRRNDGSGFHDATENEMLHRIAFSAER